MGSASTAQHTRYILTFPLKQESEVGEIFITVGKRDYKFSGEILTENCRYCMHA